ncbi:MAG TPA: signal peptidase II [Petrotogaceae bacterium]|nr:signal peptidase II [Petrotogaceae bacterium]
MSWIVPVIIFADQLIKVAAKNYLFYNPIKIWFFELTYTENTGIAFGAFKGASLFFGVVSVVVAVIMLIARDRFYRQGKLSPLGDLAVNMIIGGAIGNMVDRVRLGYVVDMFYIPFFSVFNVADSFVTIGAVLLAIYFLRTEKIGAKNTSNQQ